MLIELHEKGIIIYLNRYIDVCRICLVDAFRSMCDNKNVSLQMYKNKYTNLKHYGKKIKNDTCRVNNILIYNITYVLQYCNVYIIISKILFIKS